VPRFGTRLWLAFGFLAMASVAQAPAISPGGPGGHGHHLKIAVTAPTAATSGDEGLQAGVPEVSGETYAWSIVNGTILSDPHQAAITFSAGSAGALHLLCAVQDAEGSQGDGRQIVHVEHAPEITSFTASRPIITVGSSVTLTVAFRWGQGTLDPGIGSVSSGQVITVQPAQTTTYVLTVTNALGKAVTASQTVTVVPPPDATLTAPSAVTAGVPGFLASVPSVQGSTYAWSLSNGTITSATSQNQIAFTPGTVGSLSLTCTVTNAAGDWATGKQTLPVSALPVLSSFTAAPVLVTRGTSVALTGVFSGGTGKVDPGVGLIQSSQAISVTPLATTTYMLTVDNGAGGVVTRTGTVTVVPPPDPTITAAPVETQGTAGELASVPDAPGTTFVWSLAGGTITAGQGTHQITYTLLNGTTATLQCVVTNAAGTAATGTTSLQLVAPPDATLTAPSIVTSGPAGLAASVPDQPGCTFLWNLTGGTLTAGAGTHAITFTADVPGTLHLTCLVTNAAGTATTGAQDIQAVAPPLIQDFLATPSTITTGQSATLSFDFTGGTGALDQGVGPVQSGVSVQVRPTVTTTYTLTVTNTAGAVITRAVTVVVNAAGPGSVTLKSPSLIRLTLAGQYQFLASIVGSGGHGGPALRGLAATSTTPQPKVLWSVQEAGGGTIDSSGFYTAPMTPGTYHVVATNSLDATKFAVATVMVIAPNPAVSLSVTPSSSSASVGSPVTLVSSVQGTSNQAVDWVLQGRLGATLSPQGNQAVFQASVSGAYTIRVTSQADPSKSVEAFINVNDAGAPTIGAFTASLTSIPAGAATTLSWSVTGATTLTVDGLNVTGQTSESVKPTYSYDYLLVASNAQGASYAQVHVDVQAPTIQLFMADQASVPVNGTVNLTAYFFNGQGQVDQGVGPITSGVPVQVKPNGNTTYTLTVTNALGASVQSTLSVQVTVPGAIELGGPMAINSNYYDFQSAQLYDSRVLSFFGQSTQSNLYNPVHAMSTIAAGVPALTAPGGRRYPAFTVMTDGRLLLGGGYSNGYGAPTTSDWAIFDSAANTFTSVAGPLAEGHTLVSLLDGRVLLSSGISGRTSTGLPAAPSGSFVFDSTKADGNPGQWQTVTGDIGIAWGTGQATLLADGRVLLSGGRTSTGIGTWSYDHLVGLFDPAQNSISIIGKLDASFYPSWPDLDASSGMGTNQLALPNGKVLFMGQATGSWISWAFPAAIFDPATSQLTRLQGPRARVVLDQPQMLPNGLVVFLGDSIFPGTTDAQVYDPIRNAFYVLAQTLNMTTWYQTQQSALLQDGRIFWPGVSSYDSASSTYSPGTTHLFTYPFDLTITPWTATTNVGIPVQFKATTKDGRPVTWSAASGSIDAASGIFTANTPGIYSVTATDDTGRTAQAKAVVLPAPTMAVTPTQITLDPGGVYGFSAHLANTPIQAVSWKVVEGAAGGTVTDQGLYVAPTTLGTYHLQAYSPIYPSATAVATITVAQPTGSVLGVQVSPLAATVLVGGNAAFKAVVATTTGPSSNVTWQVYEGAAGGTVQAGALGYVRYQAPLTAGTYHLLAISNANQSVMAMATVTVVSADGSGSGGTGVPSTPPVSVSVSPHDVSITAGIYQDISANVSGAADTTVTWKVDDGSGNNVATYATVQSGVFIASKAGTYVVTATSTVDSTASDFVGITVSSSVQTLNPTQVPLSPSMRGYTVTAMKDGRILIAGGETDDGQGHFTVYGASYIYDPVTKAFTATGSLIQPRAYHHAVLLDDGRILITEGESFYACPADPTGTLGTCTQYPLLLHEVPWAEIYDPTSGTFQALPVSGRSPSSFQRAGLMNDSHRGGQILKMANGKVMVWGGWGDFMHSGYDNSNPQNPFWSWNYLVTTIPDFFDPATSLFALISDQNIPSTPTGEPFSALASLPDGRVLIAGGLNPSVPPPGQVSGPPAADVSTRIFDPNASTYIPGPSLTTPRCDHTATTLSDGRILIVGGATTFNGPMDLASFDPIPGHYWQDTPTAEIYDPATGAITPTGSLNESRANHAAVLLPSGQVLIVGGWHYTGNGQHTYPHTTELYDPDTGIFTVMDHLDYGLDGPMLVLQQDGNIFVSGTVEEPLVGSLPVGAIRNSFQTSNLPGLPLLAAMFGTLSKLPPALDFVSVNQGVERYLDDATQKSGRTDQGQKTWSSMVWKGAVPLIANRPIRFHIYMRDLVDVNKIRIRIYKSDNTDLYNKDLDINPSSSMNEFGSGDGANNSVVIPLDENQTAPPAGSNSLPLTLYVEPDPQKLYIKDEGLRGSLIKRIPFTLIQSRPIKINLVKLQYYKSGATAALPYTADLATFRTNLIRDIQRYLPVSYNQIDVEEIQLEKGEFAYKESDNGNLPMLTDTQWGSALTRFRDAVGSQAIADEYYMAILARLDGLTGGPGELGVNGISWPNTHFSIAHTDLFSNTNTELYGVHEFGHDLGLLHAPWPIGVPDADLSWPGYKGTPGDVRYSGAGIGVPGYDFKNRARIDLMSWGQKIKDIMCHYSGLPTSPIPSPASQTPNNYWISDYDFQKVFLSLAPVSAQ